jgi:hypothetical protein
MPPSDQFHSQNRLSVGCGFDLTLHNDLNRQGRSPSMWNFNDDCRKVFHKSLQFNAVLAKLPARCVNTQINHLFASMIAVFKMECLKIRIRLNRFVVHAKCYFKATHFAFDAL